MEELRNATAFLKDSLSALPGVFADFDYAPEQLSSVLALYNEVRNTAPVGTNAAVGNRLLDARALSNLTALRAAMQKATPSGTVANLNLISGPGLRNARPAGGDASINPAWRDAYIEYGTS